MFGKVQALHIPYVCIPIDFRILQKDRLPANIQGCHQALLAFRIGSYIAVQVMDECLLLCCIYGFNIGNVVLNAESI